MTKIERIEETKKIIKNNLNKVINYDDINISDQYVLCWRVETNQFYNLFYQSKDMINGFYKIVDVYVYKDKKHKIEVLAY